MNINILLCVYCVAIMNWKSKNKKYCSQILNYNDHMLPFVSQRCFGSNLQNKICCKWFSTVLDLHHFKMSCWMVQLALFSIMYQFMCWYFFIPWRNFVTNPLWLLSCISLRINLPSYNVQCVNLTTWLKYWTASFQLFVICCLLS